MRDHLAVLPDNFIEGDALRRSIVDSNPKISGKIDRFGNFLDGSGRYLIAPYLRYSRVEELLAFAVCAKGNDAIRDDYRGCFATRTGDDSASSQTERRQRSAASHNSRSRTE